MQPKKYSYPETEAYLAMIAGAVLIIGAALVVSVTITWVMCETHPTLTRQVQEE